MPGQGDERSIDTAGALRGLPSVEQLAARLHAPHALSVAAAREAIDARRSELARGVGVDLDTDLLAHARAALERAERP